MTDYCPLIINHNIDTRLVATHPGIDGGTAGGWVAGNVELEVGVGRVGHGDGGRNRTTSRQEGDGILRDIRIEGRGEIGNIESGEFPAHGRDWRRWRGLLHRCDGVTPHFRPHIINYNLNDAVAAAIPSVDLGTASGGVVGNVKFAIGRWVRQGGGDRCRT